MKKVLYILCCIIILWPVRNLMANSTGDYLAEVCEMQIRVTSPAFNNEDFIPSKYTCEGKDIMPPLVWEGVPENTLSLVLIVDDPDAPSGTFTHAIFFDIEPQKRGIEEGESPGVAGVNDFGRLGYGGPCPPKGHGPHRYYFKVYALDIPSLNLKSGAHKFAVEKAIKGHILAYGELIGKYERK